MLPTVEKASNTIFHVISEMKQGRGTDTNLGITQSLKAFADLGYQVQSTSWLEVLGNPDIAVFFIYTFKNAVLNIQYLGDSSVVLEIKPNI